MPFSPKILQLVTDAGINPECLAAPEPAPPVNAYSLLGSYHFVDINGKPVSLPRFNHRFTITFGVSGCALYCSDNNRALSEMPADWQHVVIAANPEFDGRSQQFRNDFRKGIVKDPLGARTTDVPNVTVLFPVDANGQLSNAEARRLETYGFDAYTNASNAKAHDPLIHTFDAEGCVTGHFESADIFKNKYPLKQGCSR